MNRNAQNKKERKNGVTLVEMLVVLLIFSLVIGILMSIFVSFIKAQRYILASQQIMDQASYVVEYMGRAIRMAKKDENGDCIDSNKNYLLTPDNHLKFKNYKGDCEEFYLENEKIYQEKGDQGKIQLTSSKFKVTKLKFIVMGDNPGDTYQPRVTILLEMEAKDIKPVPKIKIQTTVSQRDLDWEEE